MSLYLNIQNILSLWHLRHDMEEAGRDDVAGHGEEAWRQAGLGQHTKLDLIETNSLVITPPVPPRDVQQVGLGERRLRFIKSTR